MKTKKLIVLSKDPISNAGVHFKNATITVVDPRQQIASSPDYICFWRVYNFEREFKDEYNFCLVIENYTDKQLNFFILSNTNLITLKVSNRRMAALKRIYSVVSDASRILGCIDHLNVCSRISPIFPDRISLPIKDANADLTMELNLDYLIIKIRRYLEWDFENRIKHKIITERNAFLSVA